MKHFFTSSLLSFHLLVLLIVTTLALPGLLTAQDYSGELMVTSLADTKPTTGGSGSGAEGDLRWCVNQANAGAAGDTPVIRFALNGTVKLKGKELILDADITIIGNGNANTVVDAGGTSRVFMTRGGRTVAIEGVKVSGGNGSGENPTSSNSTRLGGGVFNHGGTLTMTDCIVTNCKPSGATTLGGGGICNYSGSAAATLTLVRCKVQGNLASDSEAGGGGICNLSDFHDANFSALHCTISGNSSTFDGGGFSQIGYRGGATARLENCSLSANSAKNYGGAIYGASYPDSSFIYMQGCTLAHNIAAVQGGGATVAAKSRLGLGALSSQLKIGTSTIAGNNAPKGAGIALIGGVASRLYMRSSLMAKNITGGCFSSDVTPQDTGLPANVLSYGFNLFDDITGKSYFKHSTDLHQVSAGLQLDLNLKPILKDNGGSTHTIALLPTSAAIDKGLATAMEGFSAAPDQDQRGFARIVDNAALTNADGGDGSDIGAFEHPPIVPIVSLIPAGSSAITSGGQLPFGTVATGSTVTKTITIKNIGYAALNLGTVSVDGDFNVTQPHSISLAPGASTTMVVTFTAGGLGPKTAIVLVPSDAPAGTFELLLTADVGRKLAAVSVPDSITELEGEAVSFTPGVEGIPPFRYQWLKNGTKLSGKTADTLEFANIRVQDGGSYTLQVRDTGSSYVLSIKVDLTVVGRLNSFRQLAVGKTAVMSAVVGGPVKEYRWSRLNGSLPSLRNVGAATRTLSLKTLELGDADDYVCEVFGTAGSKPTGLFTLAVVDEVPQFDAIQPHVLPTGSVGQDYSLTGYRVPMVAGASRAPLSFSASGLPKGLRMDSATGAILGRPTQASLPGRPFAVTIYASNAKGKSTLKASLVVDPLPTGTTGIFSALMTRDAQANGDLGGWLTVTVSASGSFTGSMKSGVFTLPLKGTVLAAPAALPYASLLVTDRRAGQYQLDLTFDGSNNAISGTLSHGGGTATINGGRHTFFGTSAAGYAALYNSAVELPAGTVDDGSQPQGAGWQQMSVKASGAATGAGRTPDGVSYSFSGSLWPDGTLPQFVVLYGGKGSITGQPQITLGAATVGNINNRVTGWVEQIKLGPASTTDRIYKTGIPLLRREVDGSPWVKPVGTSPIVLGLAEVAAPGKNASIAFTAGGLTPNEQTAVDQQFRIAKNNSCTFDPVSGGNPAAVKVTITAATGLFTTGFTLVDDGVKRTVLPGRSAGGILLSQRSLSRPKGVGYFLLPGLNPSATTSDVLSGKVEISPLAP